MASVFGRKFLGFSLWVVRGGEVKLKVAKKPLIAFKRRIRELTRRLGGRSMMDVVDRLRSYLLGWKGYFCYVQTPGILQKLDKWVRHRLRAILLKSWRHSHVIYRELMKLGAPARIARMVASKRLGWWRNINRHIKYVLTVAYFDQLGVPQLC